MPATRAVAGGTADVDERFALRPELLASEIREDVQAGLVPCFVCATVGTTSSNGLDPVRAIAALCPVQQNVA